MDLDYLGEKYHEEMQLAEEARDYEDEWGEEAEKHELRALVIDDLMSSAGEDDLAEW